MLQSIKQVGDESDILFMNLAAMLARKWCTCYDGCHFNEEGERVAADRIANLFIESRFSIRKESNEN